MQGLLSDLSPSGEVAAANDVVPRDPIAFRGERVLTTELLARAYGTASDNIQMNHSRNAERFVEGTHYIKLTGSDLRAFKNQPTASGLVAPRTAHLILWTERGAARHAKLLDTEMAWEIFEQLEDTYFRVQAEAAKLKAIAATSPRETRLWLKQCLELGSLRGLGGAQLAIYASRVTKAATGFDALSDMGGVEMIAPTNDRLVTPTAVGEPLGISGRQVNQILLEMGFHEGGPGAWRPTETGKAAGGLMVDVDRSNGTGAAQQLKWPSAMTDVIRDHLAGRRAA